ncbi:hypothetical protein B0A52_04063 [Exophiala mesophila]|uniref:DUF4185 domain-containing protein n=1 Tax=Exophiala mesophila TaxID=212818 RepID=A0A438NAJ1_EXOME|nr:hypothetical protein B0A52_04063 [Exophiala mesophila]
MRSSFWRLLAISISIATVTATPLVRRYDLDGNGVPDYCYDEAGLIRCMLADGSWTTVPRKTDAVTVTKVCDETAPPRPPFRPRFTRPPFCQPLGPPDLPTEPCDQPQVSPQVNAIRFGPYWGVPASETATADTTPSSETNTRQPEWGVPASELSSQTSQSYAVIQPVPSSSAPTQAVPTLTPTPTPTPTPSPVAPPPSDNLPTGKLPSPEQWKLDKGSKWSMEYVGDIKFTGGLAGKDVVGDKCRSSKLGDKIIWNCGDIGCNPDVLTCGFSMGPAFYGTGDVMTIDATGVKYVQENDFLKPWQGDQKFGPPYQFWGMDTSNVAPINDTHGVAFAWQIFRGAPNNGHEDRGNAVAVITLGEDKPIATRIGPLLTGPDKIALGLIAVLRAENYIYIYSDGGPSTVMVGRVRASDDVFDESKYEFLQFGSTGSWVPGIPSKSSNSFGATSLAKNQKLGCDHYGSAFYNNYLHKYVLMCNIFMDFVKFYTSDTPYGPWSDEYSLASGSSVQGKYGIHAHPDFSPDGSHKSFYFSMGPNTKMNMYKVTLNY